MKKQNFTTQKIKLKLIVLFVFLFHFTYNLFVKILLNLFLLVKNKPFFVLVPFLTNKFPREAKVTSFKLYLLAQLNANEYGIFH